MKEITENAKVRAEINPVFQRLGIRIGLNFSSVVKGQKRVVQRLVSGRMVFGDAPLPVPLFGKDNLEGQSPSCPCGTPAPSAEVAPSPVKLEKFPNNLPAALSATRNESMQSSQGEKQAGEAGAFPASPTAVGDRTPALVDTCQPEGISITKVSRGDRRPTFPNDFAGRWLLWQAFAQRLDFTADTFLAWSQA